MESLHDLKPGEFQLFCAHCGWKAEKNAAMSNACPQCGKPLSLASEPRKDKDDAP
jgi:predicted RNA-binding Zn-ribbon protein involved in translation (DUF1610 family)